MFELEFIQCLVCKYNSIVFSNAKYKNRNVMCQFLVKN